MLRKARARYTTIWLGFFRDYNVLLTPSMPVTAFELGRLAPSTINGVAVPESYDAWCALAQPANLAGLPAVSVPIGPRRSGLPVGLQNMSARWADATVLRAAAALTACLGRRRETSQMARLRRSAAPSCPPTGRSPGPPAGRRPHPRQNWPIGIQRILTMEPGRGAHSRRSARPGYE